MKKPMRVFCRAKKMKGPDRRKMTKLERQREDFILRLTKMTHEAMELKLYVTGHAVHKAVRAVGWEIAGDVLMAAKMSQTLD